VAKEVVKKGLAKYPTEKEKTEQEKKIKDQVAGVEAARKKQKEETE
jgi:hypothetical protein